MIRYYLISIVLLISACVSGVQSDSGEGMSASPSSTRAALSAMAPGTAKVSLTIVSVDSAASPPELTVAVIAVLGYGSATPVIASETKLTVSLFPPTLKDLLPPGRQVVVILQHIGEGTENIHESPRWQLRRIDPTKQ